jgi:hypothetical protein
MSVELPCWRPLAIRRDHEPGDDVAISSQVVHTGKFRHAGIILPESPRANIGL